MKAKTEIRRCKDCGVSLGFKKDSTDYCLKCQWSHGTIWVMDTNGTWKKEVRP